MSVQVRISQRAARQIEAADAWWAEHRLAAIGALQDDVRSAIGLLSHQPEIGARFPRARRADVRRLFLQRTRHNLYYHVGSDGVNILALWHASRKAEPNL